MKFQITGPPPKGSLVPTKKAEMQRVERHTWRGRPPTDKYAWRFNMRACPPQTIEEHQVLTGNLSLKVRDHSDFGGIIKRVVLLVPEEEGDEEFPLWSWSDLLGPITATEAWIACRKVRMETNGIIILHKGVLHRFYEEVPGRCVYKVFYKASGVLKDETPTLDAAVSILNPSHRKRIKSHYRTNVHGDLLLRLACLDALASFSECERTTFGWEVSPIWRTKGEALVRQAQALDFKNPEYLLKRLRRRKEARERALKEGRR